MSGKLINYSKMTTVTSSSSTSTSSTSSSSSSSSSSLLLPQCTCRLRRKQRLLAILSLSTALSLFLLILHASSSISSPSSASSFENIDGGKELPERTNYVRHSITAVNVRQFYVKESLFTPASYDMERFGAKSSGNPRSGDKLGEKSPSGEKTEEGDREIALEEDNKLGKDTIKDVDKERRGEEREIEGVADRKDDREEIEMEEDEITAQNREINGDDNSNGDDGAWSPPTPTRTIHPPLLLNLDYSRQPYYPWRTTTDECANYATRFLVPGRAPIVALVSFPGSGNTWLRYLAEALTGVFTGSVYHDEMLALRGFWGEREGFWQGSTLLQKTHSYPLLPSEAKEEGVGSGEFRFLLPKPPRRVVILLRNPWECLLSLRHYHAAGHTGFGSSVFFRGPGWQNFTEERAKEWVHLNWSWLSLPSTDTLVLHYEHLQHRLEQEASRLMTFLGLPLDHGRLECLLRYPEGRFRRPKYPKHLQGYTFPKASDRTLRRGMRALSSLLTKGGHPPFPWGLYSFTPPIQPPP